MFNIAFTAVLILLLVPAHGQMPKPSVIVKPVAATSWVDTIEALGTLRANESVVISSSVADIVSRVHFNDGDNVDEGQLLLEMNSREQQAELDQERAAVAEATAQFERTRDLAKRGNATTATLDLRRRELDTAQARLQAIESRVADRSIRAPFAGVVGLRTISAGAYLQAGMPITELHDITTMKLDFTVPSTFLDVLRIGLNINAYTDAFPMQEFVGIINSLDNRVDPVTRAVTVRALIDNPEGRLKPGLLMRVDLFKNGREALTIPEEALLYRGRDMFVFVVDSTTNKAARRQVTLGARRLGEVEVLSGLAEGDKVVTHGGFVLNDGQEVTIKQIDDGTQALPAMLRPTAPTGL